MGTCVSMAQQSLESEEPLIKLQTRPLPGHTPASFTGEVFCHQPVAKDQLSSRFTFPTGADFVRKGHRNLTYRYTAHTYKNKNECTYIHM